jgi:phosphoadenosine phosphosulfate reductase
VNLADGAVVAAGTGRSAVALYARATPGFEARVAASVALLREAADRHPGRVVQVSSLGVEGMVITDLIARHRLPIPVATLDTGMLHASTLALVDRIRARYGIAVEVFRPRRESVVHFVRRHGGRAMFESVALRKACCAVRKVEPMQRLVEGRTAWITGLRREQSEQRQEVPERAIDADGREKFCPLAAWTWADVWHHVQRHDVPTNPLHDQFYPSVGCAPCTRAIAVGEDFRAGRWWWEQEGDKECGLHRLPPAASPPLAARATSPAAARAA